MEFYILDTEFNPIFLVERAESLIWTDRYCGYGDFEIYAPVDTELFAAAQIDNYVWYRNSDRLMIIDTVTISSEFETGTHLKISGRSLEGLLERRIIWHKTTFDGTIQKVLEKALNENAISPADTNRVLPGLEFRQSSDSELDNIKVTCQETGTNLYTFVVELCQEAGLGFKIVYDDNANKFAFSLYTITDRSYSQDVNPYVVFSNEFENLFNSNYYDSTENYSNVALVAGEDREGTPGEKTEVIIDHDDDNGDIVTIITKESSDDEQKARISVTVPIQNPASGLARRELYVDARDIQSENEDGTTISDAEYAKLLINRGQQKLAEVTEETLFEGEVEPNMTFRYGVDYFLGDMVQLRNEFGVEGRARITEIVWSHDESGEVMVPTFELVD